MRKVRVFVVEGRGQLFHMPKIKISLGHFGMESVPDPSLHKLHNSFWKALLHSTHEHKLFIVSGQEMFLIIRCSLILELLRFVYPQ